VYLFLPQYGRDDGTHPFLASSIILILLTACRVSEAGFQSIEEDGQRLKGEYYFTNYFFPPSSASSFLLPCLQKGALIKPHRLYSTFSHIALPCCCFIFSDATSSFFWTRRKCMQVLKVGCS
jgi:hypothetical protein